MTPDVLLTQTTALSEGAVAWRLTEAVTPRMALLFLPASASWLLSGSFLEMRRVRHIFGLPINPHFLGDKQHKIYWKDILSFPIRMELPVLVSIVES